MMPVSGSMRGSSACLWPVTLRSITAEEVFQFQTPLAAAQGVQPLVSHQPWQCCLGSEFAEASQMPAEPSSVPAVHTESPAVPSQVPSPPGQVGRPTFFPMILRTT